MQAQTTWHDYLIFNAKEEYQADYKDQQISKKELKSIINNNSLEKAKNNYKLSQELYSSAKLTSELLSMVINDDGNLAMSDATKKLILESKLKSLKPLLVNAASATRKAELKDYEKELEAHNEQLQVIQNRTCKLEDKSTKNICKNSECEKQSKELDAQANPLKNTSTETQTQKKKVERWFDETINFLKSLFILSPIAFVKWVGELNLYRLSYRFSQISWKNIWTYLKSLGILDAGSKLHGIFINISAMDYPAPIFNALSVLIFALKLCLNLTLPLKHLFAPTSQVELAFTWWTRAKIEIMRVWDIYANDLFWMIFNGITNFPLLIGLAVPIANWILVGALFFDVAILSILLYKEEKKLNDEIAWLNTQIVELKQIIKPQDKRTMETEQITSHIEMYEAMLNQARIVKISNRAAVVACIIATAMFITSMALILSLATPLTAPIGFMVCVLAVAIILARKDIGKYAEAKASQHVFKTQDFTKDLRAEKAKKAGLQLAKSLAEFIFIPMIIIGLFTISWPAAVAFTAIYICTKASGIKLTSSGCDDKTKRIKFEDMTVQTISPIHA